MLQIPCLSTLRYLEYSYPKYYQHRGTIVFERSVVLSQVLDESNDVICTTESTPSPVDTWNRRKLITSDTISGFSETIGTSQFNRYS